MPSIGGCARIIGGKRGSRPRWARSDHEGIAVIELSGISPSKKISFVLHEGFSTFHSGGTCGSIFSIGRKSQRLQGVHSNKYCKRETANEKPAREMQTREM
jgi:hypothetical protein